MKLVAMLDDVFTSLFASPVTEKYPFERKQEPAHLRSQVVWDPEQCTGCGLCAKDCPSSAIDVVVIDRKEKRFVLRYHLDRCTFCAQCVFSCRQGALQMSSTGWELAALSKEPLDRRYGNENDVRASLEGVAQPEDGTA